MRSGAVLQLLRRAAWTITGLALGGLTAFGEFVLVLVTGVALAVPAARPGVFALVGRVAEVERRRVARFLGRAGTGEYSGRRAWLYLAARCVVGGIGAGVLLFGVSGAIGASIGVWQLATGRPFGGAGELTWWDPITFVLLVVLGAFLVGQGLVGVATAERWLAARFLAPSGPELLRRRVSELATSRAEVVEAVNTERRRIERDLHDGVQQRLVALGMLLGRARRSEDASRAAELVRQAHEDCQRALEDLREVSWRVYPIMLDGAGLHAALESLAERSAVPVRLRYGLTERMPIALETVAYFVVSEAVTNASKHAAASLVEVEVARAGSMVVVGVSDDGVGGASATGAGLDGLARRVAATDGRFTVHSPAGGPTRIVAELPCG